MKICIICHEYPPNIISGCGTALSTLSRGLIRKGHKVTIITPLIRTELQKETSYNLEIIRLPIFQSKFLSRFNLIDNRLGFSLALRKFRKKFDFSQFDILHVYDVHDSYFLDKPLIDKVKTIISVNDQYAYITPWNIFRFPYKTPNLIKRYSHSMLTKVLNKNYLKKVAHIIALSNEQKRVLVENCKLKESSVKVIYRGMEIKRFSISKNKYSSGKILFIGSNMERKGVDFLILSMLRILEKFPKTHLAIIGKTNASLKRKFGKIIEENNLENNISMFEYIPSAEIPNYFADANVFIMPSIIENLAVTVLEAMSSQTPVIATRVGGHEEAVDDSCGVLINPGSSEEIANAVIDIFSSPKKAKKMGENGLKTIKSKFAEQKMIEEVNSYYLRVLKETK